MAFKESNDSFESKGGFIESTFKFLSEEAAFVSEESDDLGNGVEKGAETVALKMADNDRKRERDISNEIKSFNEENPLSIRAINMELKAINKEDKELRVREEMLNFNQAQLQNKLVSGNISQSEANKEKMKLQEESRFCNEERDRIDNRRTELNETKHKKQTLDKQKKEAKKKAAAKTSIANVLKRSKEVKKDLAGSDEASGDAFKDGSSGVVGVILDTINPFTYLKHLGMTLVIGILPYAILIIGIVTIIMTIIAIIGMSMS